MLVLKKDMIVFNNNFGFGKSKESKPKRDASQDPFTKVAKEDQDKNEMEILFESN